MCRLHLIGVRLIWGIIHSKGPEFFMGRYIPWLDKIEIFKNEHETLEGIIKTTIHEYTHHTQNMFEYKILLNQVGYSSNPLEIEAREKFDLASEGDLIFVFSDEE